MKNISKSNDTAIQILQDRCVPELGSVPLHSLPREIPAQLPQLPDPGVVRLATGERPMSRGSTSRGTDASSCRQRTVGRRIHGRIANSTTTHAIVMVPNIDGFGQAPPTTMPEGFRTTGSSPDASAGSVFSFSPLTGPTGRALHPFSETILRHQLNLFAGHSNRLKPLKPPTNLHPRSPSASRPIQETRSDRIARPVMCPPLSV